MSVWKTALLKIDIVEQEFSLHKTASEAQAAAIDLERSMGLEPARLTMSHCPSTGELLIVVITKEA